MVLPTIEVLIKCWFSVYRDVRLRKREKFSIFYVGWDAWQLLAWDTVRSSVVQVVHGPDHFSVPILRTKAKCYQLMLVHKLFSNLYDNRSE